MNAKILIVEDEPVIAADIELTLLNCGYRIAGIAYSSTQALDMIVNRQPDLVLLDIAIKGDMDGIDIASVIQQKYHIPFIYLTSFSDKDTLERAKPTLPEGYIVKPFKDRDILSSIEMALYRTTQQQSMHLTIQRVNQLSSHPITESEFKIINLIREGRSNQEIADQLYVSINTIKTHLKRIFEKVNVKSRAELIARLR